MKRSKDPRKSRVVHATLRALLEKFGEEYVRSSAAADRPEAVALGITDAVLLTLATQSAILLTADFDLFQAARRAGHAAQNFNHYRDNTR